MSTSTLVILSSFYTVLTVVELLLLVDKSSHLFHSYRCLMSDFWGHDQTHSENKDWDISIIVDDMAGFILVIKIEKAHLIRYSLGGEAALYFKKMVSL